MVFAYHGLLPYRDRWTQRIEFFNEGIISALMCFLFGFKDPRPHPFSQQVIGWVYVGLITVLVYVNTFWIVYVWLNGYYEREKVLEEGRRKRFIAKMKEELETPAPVYPPKIKDDFQPNMATIDERSEYDDKYLSVSVRPHPTKRNYASLVMPLESPKITYLDFPLETIETDKSEEKVKDDEFELPSDPEVIVYLFL